MCLTLDLTVISLMSAVLRLNYSGLTSVCMRAELGPLSFPLGNLLTVVMQVMSTCCDLSAQQASTLCHLPADISKIPSAVKEHLTPSPLPRRYDPLVPIAHALDAVIQLLTRATYYSQHGTSSSFWCRRQQGNTILVHRLIQES